MNYVAWEEDGNAKSALWRSENATKPPKRLVIADDSLNADKAYQLACEGTAMIWRGDYQNAKNLLAAMARRIDQRKSRKKSLASVAEAFHLHRLSQIQRAHILGMLLISLDSGYVIPLRRAPDVRKACLEAYGPSEADSLVSLRELLGVIGAYEWSKSGVGIPALGEKIHPVYGVFSPVRGEYLDLIAQASLGEQSCAFDIGTGTGVIAIMLAKRGISKIIATDVDERAISCAEDNIRRFNLERQIEVAQCDLFPRGKADIIVCNPPWIPASANSRLDHAIYDPEHRMLKGYLQGLSSHLRENGEGWLILSDLAEHLGLRTRDQLLGMFADAGLRVATRLDIKPRHPKSKDSTDVLHEARKKETTSLWILKAND